MLYCIASINLSSSSSPPLVDVCRGLVLGFFLFTFAVLFNPGSFYPGYLVGAEASSVSRYPFIRPLYIYYFKTPEVKNVIITILFVDPPLKGAGLWIGVKLE